MQDNTRNNGVKIVSSNGKQKKALTSEDAQTIFNWVKLGIIGLLAVFAIVATIL